MIEKAIEGFPGYTINENGEVFSVLNYGHSDRKEKKKRKICLNTKTGYQHVVLLKLGKHLTKTIHRLVAETFIPNLGSKPFVCHKNGIKADNRIENLYWGTPQENTNDMIRHGRQMYGENHTNTTLNIPKVKLIRSLYNDFHWKQKDIASLFCISRRWVGHITHNDTWK